MGTPSLIPMKDRVLAMAHGAKTKGLDPVALWNLLSRNADAPNGDAAKAALLQEAGIIPIDGRLYHPSFAPKSEDEKRIEKAISIAQTGGVLGVDRSYFWRLMRRDKLNIERTDARIAFVQKMGFVVNPADGRIYHPDFVPAGGFPPAAKPEGSPSPGDENGDDDGDDETGKPTSTDHVTIIKDFVRAKGNEGINKGYFRAALRQKGITPVERYGWQALFDAAGLVESPSGQLYVPEFAPEGLRTMSAPTTGTTGTPPPPVDDHDDDDDETLRDRTPAGVKDTGLGGKPHERDVIWRPGQGATPVPDDDEEEIEAETMQKPAPGLNETKIPMTEQLREPTDQDRRYLLSLIQDELGQQRDVLKAATEAFAKKWLTPPADKTEIPLKNGTVEFKDGRSEGKFRRVARIVVYFEPEEEDEATPE